jgi:predicted anti-sigma-YlaC factor YlaD
MKEWGQCEQGEQISELMSLALDGLLNAEDEQKMQQHLAACPTCRLEWQAVQQISTLFERSEMVGPPLGFAIRVDRRLAEKEKKRRRAFGGLAILTGSLSLAAVTVTALTMIVLGVVAWLSFGSVPAIHQGAEAVSQVASGMGLMGRGVTLFLRDLLVRYGPPLLVLTGMVLVLLAGIWAWLITRRSGRSHHNGYA